MMNKNKAADYYTVCFFMDILIKYKNISVQLMRALKYSCLINEQTYHWSF